MVDGSPYPLLFVRSPIIAPAKVPVREVLSRYGIVPRKRFGQNFLHDPAVAERIVEAVGASAGDHVLEIGPGLGALTEPLLERGVHVTAVEVDRRIVEYLEERFGAGAAAAAEGGGADGGPAAAGRLRLIGADVLEVDLAAEAPDGAHLVSNVPYSITGPLLGRIMDAAHAFPSAVLMVQKEVAVRLSASAGGKELGAPAVILQLLYRIRKLFDVGGGAFLPPPDVASSVVRLERIPGAEVPAVIRDSVNTAYRNRRKMLRKTLAGNLAAEDAIVAALEGLGHAPTARPEELAPEDWPRLVATARGEVS